LGQNQSPAGPIATEVH